MAFHVTLMIESYPPVKIRQHDLNAGEILKQVLLVCPDLQFCAQLWHGEKRPPATDLLGFQDVTKDVITDV